MVPVENCLLLYFVIGMPLLLVDTEKCGSLDFSALAHVVCATPPIDGIWQLSGVTVLPKVSMLEERKISAVPNNFSVNRI